MSSNKQQSEGNKLIMNPEKAFRKLCPSEGQGTSKGAVQTMNVIYELVSKLDIEIQTTNASDSYRISSLRHFH